MTEPKSPRRHYSNPSFLGIPYSRIDVDLAVEDMKDVYLHYSEENAEAAFRIILGMNETVVTRCGVLTTFSSIFIAICLFIATRPEALPNTVPAAELAGQRPPGD
jgi:hypothetical protein